MTPFPFKIIPCSQWGARAPKATITDAGKYNKAIFHHTAGHALGSADGESYDEAVKYVRSVQNYHMDHNGWNDSGHNFLVTRNGYIFEGRHRSLDLLQFGHCPVSAHCVGQNSNPGVEHEQVDPEHMTPIQRQASAWLFAKICRNGSFTANRIFGHRDFNATSCPGVLYADLTAFRADVNILLRPPSPNPSPSIWRTPEWFGAWAIWWLQGQDADTRPEQAPTNIPQGAFRTLDRIVKLAKGKP